MKLLTKALFDEIPALYAQEGKQDEATVYVKFFTPDANWTWYATEASALVQAGSDTRYIPLKECLREWGLERLGQRGFKHVDGRRQPTKLIDIEFFGLVDGLDSELGYFHLSELQKVRGRFRLPVERDLYFERQPIGKFMAKRLASETTQA